jgi:hypothetical protein
MPAAQDQIGNQGGVSGGGLEDMVVEWAMCSKWSAQVLYVVIPSRTWHHAV